MIAAGSPRPAVLFDIDGTLVDSNYLHIVAWGRAFGEVGLAVESWRIHRSIGMDGSLLVDTLSNGADASVQHRLKDLHARYYKQDSSLLRVMPGARNTLEKVASCGLQVVLATSAPEDELSLLRGLLDSDDIVSAVTSSEDVRVAKPKPDIVAVALARAGVDAHHAVFVGDTVWDVAASGRADVPSVGLLSGGISRAELESAGACAVYDNISDLTGHLDESPIGVLQNRSQAGYARRSRPV